MPIKCSDFDCFGKFLGGLNICTGIIFICLVIPYIYTFTQPLPNAVYYVVYAISLVINVVIGICGFVVTFCPKPQFLASYACVNIVMFVVTVAQLIWGYASYVSCQEYGYPGLIPTASNPFGFFCSNTDDLLFWVPTLVTIFVNVVGTFSACGMMYKAKKIESGSSGGGTGKYYVTSKK